MSEYKLSKQLEHIYQTVMSSGISAVGAHEFNKTITDAKALEARLAKMEGRLLAYEQREAGYELCESHEGHWHPIEEMHMDSEGIWLCQEAWDELVAATQKE